MAESGIEVASLYDNPYYQNATFKAVMIANEEKALAMLRYLLEKGVAVDYVDYLKQTALYYASREGKCTVIRLLVENGCHVNHVDTYG